MPGTTGRKLVKLVAVQRRDVTGGLHEAGVGRQRLLVLEHPPVNVGSGELNRPGRFPVLLQVGRLPGDSSQEVHIRVRPRMLPSLPRLDHDSLGKPEVSSIEVLRDPGRRRCRAGWGGHGVRFFGIAVKDHTRAVRPDDARLHVVVECGPVTEGPVGSLDLAKAILASRRIAPQVNHGADAVAP